MSIEHTLTGLTEFIRLLMQCLIEAWSFECRQRRQTGDGMSDEWPAIFYPQDYPEYGYDGMLEPGIVMSVESYVGEVGGPEGVKLEQQIVITEDGHKLLCKFPFEEELLA